jgi:TM2 domain-containing membrane protein YozV
MRLFLLFLAGGLLVLTPEYRTMNAQDRGRVQDLGSLVGTFGTAVDDSLSLRHSTEGSVDHSDVLKNPELATALSVLVPGLGQVYNGEPVKGAVIMAGFLGSIAVCIAANIGDTNDSIGTKGWIGVGMVATSYLWGVIDAPISAQRINRERSNRTTQSLLEIRAGACSISLTTGMAPGGISACVRLGI